ncbi:MAG: helix-turn-helix domain-containing protein [Robiginitomaculum sp.]
MQVIKHSKSDLARAQLVMAAVALEFGIPDIEVYSRTKGNSKNSFARQIAMYLTHIVYEINLSRVARTFSRDRSTASHACRVVEESREDPIIDEKLIRLEQFLENSPQPAPEMDNA